MKDAAELRAGLAHFYGTEQWFRHGINPKMLYTEGVQFFAEHAGNGAYWFLDIVATELMELNKKEEFIAIKLIVDEGGALILASDGDVTRLFERKIEYTDCPIGEWSFYLEGGVMLLPSEH